MGIFNKMQSFFNPNQIDYFELIDQGAIVIDVRTQSEFRDGHIEGSRNIPLQELDGKLEDLKGQTVILVCRSGARAGRAKSLLESVEISAYNAGAWGNLNR